MNYIRTFSWMLLLLLMAFESTAQQLPLSFSKEFQDKYDVPLLIEADIPAFDGERIQKEDQDFPGNPRLAAPLPVDLGLTDSGQWIELEKGDRLWRLKINSKDALGLILLFDRFYLPPGAHLFTYSEDKTWLQGPYTGKNNSAGGRMTMGPLTGQTLILEYFEPAFSAGSGRLHLFRVDHVYHKDNFSAFEKKRNDIGFNTSLPCNLNINCPEGSTVQMEKRAVCRILMILEEGSGFCTGSLLNNTLLDGKPYVLSAFHCQDGYTPKYDMWRFDFNYEVTGCETPSLEPIPISVQGCVQRAGRQENDFLLLEATATIPPLANHYFLGWNRGTGAPQSSTIIHHPNGDIKKLAIDTDQAVIHPRAIEWNNDVTTPANNHFKLIYSLGTFELGSSGAALLDQDKRVVGQLHGGFNVCSETTGFFGRLALSWEGGGTPETRLKDWLDPLGTGQMTLDGMPSLQPSLGTLSGKIMLEDGRGIANVSIYLSGNSISDSTTTDANGNYIFQDLPMIGGYGLSVVKKEEAKTGVSALDIVLIQKHLLSSKQLASMYKMLAADVNQSKSITLIDLVKIRKVLLGSVQNFGGTPIWQFLPVGFDFMDDKTPFSTTIPSIFYLMDFTRNLQDHDFIGYKTGDVNGSVNPGN